MDSGEISLGHSSTLVNRYDVKFLAIKVKRKMNTCGPPEREKWRAKNFPGCKLITIITNYICALHCTIN